MPLTDALTRHLTVKDLVPAAGFIGGDWLHEAAGGETFEVTNPATGEVLARLPDMGVAEARRAIAAAAAAQAAWAQQTGKARAAVLRRLHGLLLEHQADLGAIMTAEQGTPLAEAKGEIAYGAS
jgi:succinate-semialdehyde dehydrogenase/glutarate-semialdehyde dehydrogenase